MRIAATALALLSLATTASATLRVFVTSSSAGYGLESPANHMIPTISTVLANGENLNGYDYADQEMVPGPLRPGTYPPFDAPSGTAESPIEIPPGGWAYIWLQFQGETKGAKIAGLETVILDNGVVWDPNNPVLPAGISTTYYVCNNTWYPLAYAKRWAGPATPPAYPEWHNNPQVMTAPSSWADYFCNTPANDPPNLFDGTTRIGLLGAIEAPADGRIFQIVFTNATYLSGENPTVAGGYFQFVPEPAGLLALGLAGLLIRRR